MDVVVTGRHCEISDRFPVRFTPAKLLISMSIGSGRKEPCAGYRAAPPHLEGECT